VYAALAYYYDHQAEIQSEWTADEALLEEMKRNSIRG
jgi:hypothetical protein